MSIPHVYNTVMPQDFTLTPVKVHKKFVVQRSQFYSGSAPQTGSGYKIWNALYTGNVLKLGTDSDRLYLTNSYDGTLQNIIWKSIHNRYYKYPNDPYKTLEHSNNRFTYKFLNYSASIISIPYMDAGETLLPGSIEFTTSIDDGHGGYVTRYLTDDRNGNLYDTSTDTGSLPNRSNVVAYWGFNEMFNRFPEKDGTLEKSTYKYTSNVFEPDSDTIVQSASFSDGIYISLIPSGMSLSLTNVIDQRLITKNRDDFNFTDDFTISFWVKNTSLGAISPIVDRQDLISKDSFIEKNVFGTLNKYQNDLIVEAPHVSSSFEYSPTSVFPYRIYFSPNSERIFFQRSNGIKTIETSFDFGEGSDWTHAALVKSGSNYRFYKNGNYTTEGTQETNWETSDMCYNKHSVIFGSQRPGQISFNGNLDEITFYNKALTSNEVIALYDPNTTSLYQTSVMGNVFYKSGNVVISGFDSRFFSVLERDWTLKFRSTHVIYSYECLVRIPAGSFNLSQNPSTLQNPYTDLIINEMTGSLAEGALFPYATAIGLYNDKRELMAVAKLSQPLQMRDDVNLNISIKWDS